jgi:hypothetical protein
MSRVLQSMPPVRRYVFEVKTRPRAIGTYARTCGFPYWWETSGNAWHPHWILNGYALPRPVWHLTQRLRHPSARPAIGLAQARETAPKKQLPRIAQRPNFSRVSSSGSFTIKKMSTRKSAIFSAGRKTTMPSFYPIKGELQKSTENSV